MVSRHDALAPQTGALVDSESALAVIAISLIPLSQHSGSPGGLCLTMTIMTFCANGLGSYRKLLMGNAGRGRARDLAMIPIITEENL